MSATVVVHPLPGAGALVRLAAWARDVFSRRLLLRLVGIDCVVLQGRVLPVRAVPLGVARDLVPAIIRCSRRFADWQIDEALYDDLVRVLALGLRVSPREIEALTVPLWELGPVLERIAHANALPVLEAGSGGMGEFLAALTKSTGTSSTPGSSAPPAGHGSTSTSA
jgi:hypothetical protein